MLPTQNQQPSSVQGVVTPQTAAGGASPEPSFNITNKKTGETRNVTVSQAQKMGFDDKFINDKLTASTNLKNTIATPNPLSKADQVRHDSLQTALTSLDNVQNNFITGQGSEGPLKGSIALGPLGGLLDPTGVANQKSRVETATNIAKAITGSSRAPSNITDQILNSLPAVNDTKELAQAKLDKLYGQLTSQAASFKFKDLTDQYGNQNNTGNTPSISSPTDNPPSQPQGNEPPTLLNQAPKFLASMLGLDNLKQFGNVVNNIPQTMQEGAKEIQQNGPLAAPQPALLKLLGQDPKANPVQRAYDSNGMVQGAASAIATPLIAAGSIQNLLKGGVEKGGAALSSLFPKGAGEARKAVATVADSAGKTVSGDAIIKTLEEQLPKMSPTATTSFNRFLENAKGLYAGKDIPITDSLDILAQANKAFTEAGKVGKSGTAAFNKILGDSIRSQLPEDVMKAQKVLGKALQNQSTLQKIFNPTNIAKGVVTGGATAGIFKLLGK